MWSFSIPPFVVSPLIVLLVMGIVYRDTSHRGLPQGTRLRWTGGTGVLSLSGFYMSMYVADEFLNDVYIEWFNEGVNPLTAYDLIIWRFNVGIAICAFALLVYVVERQFGPFTPQAGS